MTAPSSAAVGGPSTTLRSISIGSAAAPASLKALSRISAPAAR